MIIYKNNLKSFTKEPPPIHKILGSLAFRHISRFKYGDSSNANGFLVFLFENFRFLIIFELSRIYLTPNHGQSGTFVGSLWPIRDIAPSSKRIIIVNE